jgi:hypothetical protein
MSTRKRCLYCHQDSSGSKQVAHAFPESLFLDGPVFPIGAMCDKCNQYFGKELETMLTMHPLLAMQIQSYGLLNKKRKERGKLNVFERIREQGEVTLQFAVAPPVFKYNRQGVRVGTVTPLWDPNFRMDRFSRGLYMIAYNLAVLNRGTSMAFDEQYAPVRNYVRRPKAGEFWPFIQVVQGLEAVSLQPRVTPLAPTDGIEQEGLGDYIIMHIFNVHFLLDLLNTGTLKEGRFEISEPAGEVAVIDADWEPPKHEPQIIGDKQIHYRVRIK